MKTREEVDALKRNWENDPIWDIEETEGFEEYRDELRKYRLAAELQWFNKQLELPVAGEFVNTEELICQAAEFLDYQNPALFDQVKANALVAIADALERIVQRLDKSIEAANHIEQAISRLERQS